MHNLTTAPRSMENKSNLWLMMNGAGACGGVGAAANNNGPHAFSAGCVGVAGERVLPQPPHAQH